MVNLMKVSGLASAALVAGAMSVSAADIDFTDDSTGFSGITKGVSWVLTGSPVAPNTNEAGPGPLNGLVGDNDGVGVQDDEISFPDEYVTITFSEDVLVTSAYFLDLFISPNGESAEVANIKIGSDLEPIAASLEASVTALDDPFGFGGISLELFGSEFTFVASETNDEFGMPDFALAALDIQVVPLPAGILLLGTALGGLGLARRKRKS